MSDAIETAKFLRRYQSWRKGEIDVFYPDSHAGPNPVEISAAIERAIVALEAQPPCGADVAVPSGVVLPDHEPTIAIGEILDGYDGDSREDVWDSIKAYADVHARAALEAASIPVLNESPSMWVAFSDNGANIRMWSAEGPQKIADAGLTPIQFVLASQPAAPVASAEAVPDAAWPERFVCANPEEHFLQFQGQPKPSDIPGALVKHPYTMASQQFVDGWNACREAMLNSAQKQSGGDA